MRALILLHRWLGIAFCLLFAMWFATGIVMHFVPFPALTEAERFAGLATIDLASVARGPSQAIAASGIGDVRRVRLWQRSDGPVYLVSDPSHAMALRATDLGGAALRSEQSALAIAHEHARLRGLNASKAIVAGLAMYDQWTVPNNFDAYRPLYRVALNDDPGTELYVSSATGEVVLETTRRERWWNYAGSVAHWLYPAVLRRHDLAWNRLVWTLSLAALIAALAGAAVGTIKLARSRWATPYRGWHAWHHGLGLVSMTFVLTWIFSGWLSVDGGRMFSRGEAEPAEAAAVAGAARWSALPSDELRRVAGEVKEVEWFVFAGHIYRRERIGLTRQRLFVADPGADAAPTREFLTLDEIGKAGERLAAACGAVAVPTGDAYAPIPTMPGASVVRVICGNRWFDVDDASGILMQRLDPSRRAYRWLYGALHTLDFPALAARPALRTALIIVPCGLGLVFSLTGVVIGWRRLRTAVRNGVPALLEDVADR